jgi:putative acetyltransferase
MTLVRLEEPEDREAVAVVHRDAFGRSDEADLVEALRGCPAFLPELSLVAVEPPAGRVIGHVLFSPIEVRGERGSHPALALAPVAVLGPRQGRGVGSALIRDGLERARALGHALVIVVGHPAYYPRFGFLPATARGIRAPFAVRDEAFMALELRPGALAGVSGEVVYPAPFGISSRLPPPSR